MSSVETSFINLKRDNNSAQLPEENLLGVCSCCLELAWQQSLWEPYIWIEQWEIYGEMLQECFGIPLSKDENKRDVICGVCITRLRSALNFKNQVVTCQQFLRNHAIELQEKPHLNIRTSLEQEVMDVDNNEQKYDNQLSTYSDALDSLNNELALFSEDDIANDLKPVKKEINMDTRSNSTERIHQDKENRNNKKSTITNGERNGKKVQSRPQHRTKSKLAVNSKTLKNTSKKKNQRQVDYMAKRLNPCLLLENSTLVPFRADKGCFFCFYCGQPFAAFAELKDHTQTIHNRVTFEDIVLRFKRPDILKVDVNDICCNICHEKQENVTTLVEHLTNTHHIQFSEHPKKPVDCVIPYDLSDGKNRCSVCGKEFIFFKILSEHMNEHTTNYVCNVCGKCFLLPERLNTHKHRHITEPNVVCQHCGKKMKNEFFLRTHIRNMHTRGLYGCSVCDLKFNTFRERLAHLEGSHGMKVIDVQCSICHMTFRFPQSLYAHVKLKHTLRLTEGKYECDICSRRFHTKNVLSKHMLVHTKDRRYQCPICLKKYLRQSTLNQHLRIHEDDRRWACRACGAAFVQKCSLHSHIKHRHRGADIHELVECRKRH